MTRQITVIGGPWPERIGCKGYDVTDTLAANMYPRAGMHRSEVIIRLDDDPLAYRTYVDHIWTCVISRRDTSHITNPKKGTEPMPIKPPPMGAFAKWVAIGDQVTGTLTRIEEEGGETVQGDPCPELTIETEDGHEVQVTCSQARLWTRVAELDAEGALLVGRHIEIELTDIEKRNGGRTLKHFRVELSGKASVKVPTPKPRYSGDDEEPF